MGYVGGLSHPLFFVYDNHSKEHYFFFQFNSSAELVITSTEPAL